MGLLFKQEIQEEACYNSVQWFFFFFFTILVIV